MSGNDEIDIDLYVDIVHPPKWIGDACLRVVDLDLDVIRRRNGDVLLDDEDELELHAATLHYPPEVVAEARATADAVVTAVTDGTPPFSRPPERWLAEPSRRGRMINRFPTATAERATRRSPRPRRLAIEDYRAADRALRWVPHVLSASDAAPVLRAPAWQPVERYGPQRAPHPVLPRPPGRRSV